MRTTGWVGRGKYLLWPCISESVRCYLGMLILGRLFIYLEFYVAFNTVQVISRRVVGRAEETSTYWYVINK